MPTLVIDGGANPPFLREAARSVASALPHARSLTLAGQTHGVDPVALAPVLAEFFGA